MIFKPGQRVKVSEAAPHMPGATGVFECYGQCRIPGCDICDSWVLFDGGKRLSGPSNLLVPLSDPSAEQFIERIKKLAREPQPMPMAVPTEGNV